MPDLIINGPEDPDEKKKKKGTWAKGAGLIFPKIHQVTTSNCWKENGKVYNNFDTKKLNHLIKLQSAIQWYYNTFEKKVKKYIYKLHLISAITTAIIKATINFFNLLLH